MTDEQRDRELGMHRKITRRDFLDGVAVAVGGAAVSLGAPWLGAQEAAFSFAPEKAQIGRAHV